MAQNRPKIQTTHVERVSWRCYNFHCCDDRITLRFHCFAIRVMAISSDHIANAIRVIVMPFEHVTKAIRVIAMPSDHVEYSCDSTLVHCNTIKFYCIAMGFKILISFVVLPRVPFPFVQYLTTYLKQH